MKPVEDAFASDIFRRVVLPGIVLSVGVHPVISRWTPTVESLYGIGSTALVVAEIIVLGLGVSSAIQWIYYVYEGFRLEWVTWPAGAVNKRLLARRHRLCREIQGERDFDDLTSAEQAKIMKIYEYLRDFPVRRATVGSKEYFADRPTRLGNIIATYELYTESRYGADGTFFWYHFLNLASDAARKGFEEKYSFAETLVLTSFAGAIVAVLHATVLIGFGIGALNESFAIFEPSTSPALSAWLTLFGIVVWLLFYKASLPAHRDAGNSFRAIVDGVMPKFVEWATTVQWPLPRDVASKIGKLNEYLKSLD